MDAAIVAGTSGLRSLCPMQLRNVVGSCRSLLSRPAAFRASFQSPCPFPGTHWRSTGSTRSFHSSPFTLSGRRITYRIAASASGKGQRFSPTKNVISFRPEKDAALGLQVGTTPFARRMSRFDSGEDAFFVSKVNGEPNTVAFGVADGVGGWSQSGVDPADFSHALCSNMAQAALDWNTKVEKLSPRALMQAGYERCLADQSIFAGGSTASVGIGHDDGRVELANLGDSGSIFCRLAAIHQYSISQTHAFNAPYQLSLIPPLIRIQSSMFGGQIFEDFPCHASVTNLKMQHGDVLILATDGVLDNLFNQDILNIITDQMITAGAWNVTSESGISVAADLDKFTHEGGLVQAPRVSTSTNDSQSKQPISNPRTRFLPLQDRLALTVVRQAKVSSMDRHRDGPFAKEAQRYYPWDKWRGGKIDDICAVVVVAVEEGRAES
ncbi:conserved hypothetical protein [Histoplasma capsulatum G186AR]|uniref:Protein phosphatase n=2 Tax=Ajellomyces capsulatus TaxID=5037 RepID=C0NG03_AJECG|nr:type 2C protein phosphatase PTC7 [Histoplasma capsulatum G186AR]EEH10174.1 conserved hypothetical protein [Histoplasma capsulatum G186AR]KAG5290874.1 5-azacytidine resistance protein azr1 [Histoplasma capsulatum]QSS72801.1 5-azacytidine resistance protein azr1 [Histoplasma capsulatum G186AR]